jgi:glycosyltransferase involved in cell wall biosynthesis
MDESLLGELPESVRVHRVWSLEPTRAIQWLRRRRSARSASEGAAEAQPAEPSNVAPRGASFSGMPPWVIRLVQAFFVPDEKRLWRRAARRQALRLIPSEGIDAIVSSGPPFTAHVIARDVARRSGLPWIADFRDPWVGNYFFRPPTPLHTRLQAAWERRVVRGASGVVVVTEAMAEDLRRRHPDLPPDHFRVVPNGFDPADLPADATPDPAFSVAYMGVFQDAVRPDVFVAGLRRAIDAGTVPADSVRFRLIGPENEGAQAAMRRERLVGLDGATGYLPHRQAIAEAARSPVLLLVLPPGGVSRGILTGKLLEYLGLRHTVLGLVPEGVARSLIEEAHGGIVVDPEDVEGVARALGTLYEQWKAGALPVPDATVVERYDRRAQAGEYAALLSSLRGEE